MNLCGIFTVQILKKGEKQKQQQQEKKRGKKSRRKLRKYATRVADGGCWCRCWCCCCCTAGTEQCEKIVLSVNVVQKGIWREAMKSACYSWETQVIFKIIHCILSFYFLIYLFSNKKKSKFSQVCHYNFFWVLVLILLSILLIEL